MGKSNQTLIFKTIMKTKFSTLEKGQNTGQQWHVSQECGGDILYIKRTHWLIKALTFTLNCYNQEYMCQITFSKDAAIISPIPHALLQCGLALLSSGNEVCVLFPLISSRVTHL